MAGLFITFEGGECSGKTTQVDRLRHFLEERGVACLTTREPGGTPLGEEVRRLLLAPPGSVDLAPWAEVFLFAAARAEIVEKRLRPALAAGRVVICDRFTDSTLAYQGWGLGLDREVLEMVNQKATGGLMPDLTLLLDLEPDEAERRARGRAAALAAASGQPCGPEDDRIAARDEAFHRRVREGYLALAGRERERIRVIDAGASADEVEAAVFQAVLPLLNGSGEGRARELR